MYRPQLWYSQANLETRLIVGMPVCINVADFIPMVGDIYVISVRENVYLRHFDCDFGKEVAWLRISDLPHMDHTDIIWIMSDSV
mgnify:FL=1